MHSFREVSGRQLKKLLEIACLNKKENLSGKSLAFSTDSSQTASLK